MMGFDLIDVAFEISTAVLLLACAAIAGSIAVGFVYGVMMLVGAV